MARPFREWELFSTYQVTWVGSTAPNSLTVGVKTASETWVNSAVAAIQSAGGNWYAFATIATTFPYYPVGLILEWTATFSTQAGSASPFISRLAFDLVRTQAFAQSRTRA